MLLPLHIDPCPIIEAAFEVRFVPKIHPDAVFGLVYNALKAAHPSEVIKLPILQIPEEIRESDQNFRYKPHHQISNEAFFVQIGPRVLIVACKLPYPGWKEFSAEIYGNLEALGQQQVVESIERLGLRYVNFFDGDITGELTLGLTGEEKYKVVEKSITMLVGLNEMDNYLSVDNGPRATLSDGRNGTLIDIDTFQEVSLLPEEWTLQQSIEQMHQTEKTLFYQTLKADFIKRLSPIYSNE